MSAGQNYSDPAQDTKKVASVVICNKLKHAENENGSDKCEDSKAKEQSDV
eukprot:CAMPEP_0116917910 /NCGR_PEP_ID=MMETSP0467-20121206/19442_1 /TAXON_ID=283647 /ORGANISM="Mesodinium pulex, Strain SPMC105" /LENGTH=49 /DNA_ID=CAMNT_0004595129 /DNA_START=348 /DNA_END=497 /DNA_ORIENTATION=-